jgi:hypothetical protein
MASLRFRGQDRRRRQTLLLVALGALAGVALAAALTGEVKRRRRRRRKQTSEDAVSRLVDSAPDLPHDHPEDDSDPHAHDILEDIHNLERDTEGPLEPLAPDDEELEDRVLEAFHNDPTLRGRAIDIGAIGDGIIELTGWVNSAAEVGYAITLARGVPDVAHVMDSLTIRNPEHSRRRRTSADE